jgi:hypothetical protein
VAINTHKINKQQIYPKDVHHDKQKMQFYLLCFPRLKLKNTNGRARHNSQKPDSPVPVQIINAYKFRSTARQTQGQRHDIETTTHIIEENTSRLFVVGLHLKDVFPL